MDFVLARGFIDYDAAATYFVFCGELFEIFCMQISAEMLAHAACRRRMMEREMDGICAT